MSSPSRQILEPSPVFLRPPGIQSGAGGAGRKLPGIQSGAGGAGRLLGQAVPGKLPGRYTVARPSPSRLDETDVSRVGSAWLFSDAAECKSAQRRPQGGRQSVLCALRVPASRRASSAVYPPRRVKACRCPCHCDTPIPLWSFGPKVLGPRLSDGKFPRPSRTFETASPVITIGPGPVPVRPKDRILPVRQGKMQKMR